MELRQELPSLETLRHSGAVNEFEDQFRRLVLELYRDLLAETDYDINMLGMPHLGSIDLVRREMDADGLNLLRSDGDEGKARYLYRAWRGRNRNGRGLYFLRTYIRLLYGDAARVFQINKSALTDDVNGVRSDWYMPRLDDPDLFLDGGWRLDDIVPWREADVIFNPDEVYPSNRICVEIDYQSVDVSTYTGLTEILNRILPVRFVPEIKLVSRSAALALVGVE